MLYAFELGREWKLSLAELESIFGIGSIQRSTKTLALVESSVEVTRIFGQLG